MCKTFKVVFNQFFVFLMYNRLIWRRIDEIFKQLLNPIKLKRRTFAHRYKKSQTYQCVTKCLHIVSFEHKDLTVESAHLYCEYQIDI